MHVYLYQHITSDTKHISALHEGSITSHTLSLLSSTADGNTKGEEEAGCYHPCSGEAVLHICTTVGALGTVGESGLSVGVIAMFLYLPYNSIIVIRILAPTLDTPPIQNIPGRIL